MEAWKFFFPEESKQEEKKNRGEKGGAGGDFLFELRDIICHWAEVRS